MDPTVATALITVGGMLGVAVVAGVVQWKITKTVIDSERSRVREQVKSESSARRRERRLELLLEIVSELVAVTDPQANQFINYDEVVKLIHRAQLLLNREDLVERALNGAINDLGVSLQTYRSQSHEVKQGVDVQMAVMKAQSRVIDRAQAVFVGYSGRSWLESPRDGGSRDV